MSDETELDRIQPTALVRRPDGLWIATTQRERVYPFDSPLETSPVVAAGRTDLRMLKAFPFPRRSGILAAWRRLENAGKDGPETLAAALIVLVESVQAEEIEKVRALPLRRALSERTGPRSTAAHPRGYRGTIRKPPKSPLPEELDLRGVLCDRKQTAVVLQRLWAHRKRAAAALAAHGFPAVRVARLLSTDQPPADPFIAYHNEDAPGRCVLTPDFIEHALFSVASLPWRVVRRAHAAWIDLDVSGHEGLRDLAVHVVATGRQHGIAWIELAATIPMERRIPFLALVAGIGAQRHDPGRHASILQEAAMLATDALSINWMGVAVEAALEDVDPSYVGAAFRLAASYAPDRTFHVQNHCDEFTKETEA